MGRRNSASRPALRPNLAKMHRARTKNRPSIEKSLIFQMLPVDARKLNWKIMSRTATPLRAMSLKGPGDDQI